MRRPRGTNLVVVLGVVATALLVVLTLGSGASFSLVLSSRNENQVRARYAAEASINLAASRLVAGAPVDEVRCKAGLAEGVVTFNRAARSASVDNLKGTRAASGPRGRIVPPYSTLLVGQGRAGSSQVTVEALLTLPLFPYAVGCAGPLRSSGGLEVQADANAADESGSVLSNALDELAIILGPSTIIGGDVLAAEGIRLDPQGTRVLGEVRPRQDPVPLPNLAAVGFDPLGLEGVRELTGPLGNVTIEGIYRSPASLIINGTVDLDNGVLYVNGDVTVDGTVRGRGALMATGRITVRRTASIDSSDLVALIADSNITLLGEDPQRSRFSGVVATNGSFEARNLTIVGTFVQNDSSGTCTLHNVKLNHSSSQSVVDIELLAPPNVPKLGFGGWQGLLPSADAVSATWIGGVPTRRVGQDADGNQQMQLVRRPIAHYIRRLEVPIAVDVGDRTYVMSCYIPGQHLPLLVDPATGKFYPKERINLHTLPVLYGLAYVTDDTREAHSYFSIGSAIGRAEAEAMLRDKGLTAFIPDKLNQLEALYLEALSGRLEFLQQQYERHIADGGRRDRSLLRIDINQFLQIPEKARFVLWREVTDL